MPSILSVRLSVRLSVCLSVCLSIRLSVCLSVCLSAPACTAALLAQPVARCRNYTWETAKTPGLLGVGYLELLLIGQHCAPVGRPCITAWHWDRLHWQWRKPGKPSTKSSFEGWQALKCIVWKRGLKAAGGDAPVLHAGKTFLFPCPLAGPGYVVAHGYTTPFAQRTHFHR